MSGWSFAFDPATDDLIDDGKGSFVRTYHADTHLQLQAQCQNIGRLETGIDVQQTGEAVDEQSRAHQERERQCKFGDNQSVAACARARRKCSTSVFQTLLRVLP